MSKSFRINKKSSTPIYKQVKEYFLKLIHQYGEDSSMLPPEIEIVRQFSISRTTVRAAIKELVQEGILERVPGKGTFVKEKPNTLRFANWLVTEEPTADIIDTVVQDFNKVKFDGYIKNLGIPYDEIERQLLILATGGEAPDISALVYLWTPLLAYNGALEPLDHLYTPDFMRNQYNKTIDGVTYNGTIWGVNWVNAPTILVYHKDILQDVKGTDTLSVEYYDELLEYFVHIHESSSGEIIPFAIPVLDDELFFLFILCNFLYSFGGGVFNGEGEVIFHSGETQEAFTWLRKFIKTGHVNISNKIWKNRRLLSIGKLAFFMEGPWIRAMISYLSEREDQERSDIGFSTLPKSPKDMSYSVLWNHTLSIFKQCKNRELAEEFIKYLVCDQAIAERYYKATGSLPVLKSELENNPVYDDELGKVLKRQLETAYPIRVYNPATFNLSVNICAKAARDILIGGSNIAATLNNSAHLLKTLMHS
jgi:ABC-type glycerol-3-phosphate transport system substrate-binding protein